MRYVSAGPSQSFPDGPEELPANCDCVLFTGADAGAAYRAAARGAAVFTAVELGHECLAVHTGLEADDAHRRTVGFARFRLGTGDPTQLIEVVSQPWTEEESVAAARAFFEAAGFKTARCADVPGRIINRLIRPYFNAVLRRLDQQLASASDMDTTLRLGLGYPEGPNALLARTGLEHHYDVSSALYSALGDSDFVPSRAAQVAKARTRS